MLCFRISLAGRANICQTSSSWSLVLVVMNFVAGARVAGLSWAGSTSTSITLFLAGLSTSAISSLTTSRLLFKAWNVSVGRWVYATYGRCQKGVYRGSWWKSGNRCGGILSDLPFGGWLVAGAPAAGLATQLFCPLSGWSSCIWPLLYSESVNETHISKGCPWSSIISIIYINRIQ